jgi:membrane-bound metal-dependent hydrolase YbcI (DUF457 family)
VEPITHGLASLALARAAQKRLPRLGTSIVLIAGLAPDLDFATYLAGPGPFMRLHRTALHSLAGSAVLGFVIAAVFCAIDKNARAAPGKLKSSQPLRYAPALAACALGLGGHLLLDLASGIGMQFFWPFHARWYAWDLAANLDPWILILLIAGLLLPQLFRLVSEEIGDRRKRVRGRTGAIVTLSILCAYLGARAYVHGEAVDLLLSREYHGREPLSAGAFPSSSTPFEWSGVVATDTTIEEIEVPLYPGEEFDPDRSLTHFKPDDSLALETAQGTVDAERFLNYARFPIAIVRRIEDDYLVELHDVRFAEGDSSLDNIIVRVNLNSSSRVTRQQFLFASTASP